MKKCAKCKKEKDEFNFHKQSRSLDGLNSYCKACSRLAADASNKKKIEENKKLTHEQIWAKKKSKKCCVCKQVKISTDFNVDVWKSDGLNTSCRDCMSVMLKQYRKDNPEKIKALNSKLYQENIEERKETQRNYYKENKEKLKPGARERERKALKTNKNFKIKRYMSDNLRKGLKKGGLAKNNRTEVYLGCTIAEFIEKLTSQFSEGMSWENYGEWHIDHIRPVASFDLTKEEDKMFCFSYKNMQPLWAIDNTVKNSVFEGRRYFYNKN